MLVAIDPGHGGSNQGCFIGDFLEKDFNLNVARHLQTALLQSDIHSLLLRRSDEDRSLRERGCLSQGADLVISIHANALPESSIHGVECYYWPGNMRGKAVGASILLAMPLQLAPGRLIEAANDPSTRRDDWIEHPRNVLRVHTATAVLVECGYITYPDDLAFMRSTEGPIATAQAIAQAIAQLA